MMSRLVKIVDNKYIQIEEYKNPNICFNTNEYNDFEDYCTLREIFDPFKMFYENQELKKQLHEASLTIQEMTEQDIECPSNCEKLRQLKKQLEEKENIACNWKDSCLENAGKIEELENQQKEFINYLEDKINYYKRNTQCFSMNLIEEILQKYKEIIGVSDDKTN